MYNISKKIETIALVEMVGFLHLNKNKSRKETKMVTKRYVRLIEVKEKLIEKVNEAKERGEQQEVERLEEELFMINSSLEEEEREMSPTYSTFKEHCESET